MNLIFRNKKVTGILSILPKNEVSFEEEMENYNFSIAKSLKLKKAMGFDKRRIVEDGVCASDLCIHGLDYLFEQGLLKKEDVDALVLVTQSSDYIMPPTSNVIQGHFGLKQDMICLDINQGCAGYVIGLTQAYMLLEQEAINKVVLLNADVLSPKVSKRDRNSNPLIGDAASITIIEKLNDDSVIYGSIKMDGAGAMALNIPAGGAKLQSSEATAELKEDASGNFRSQDHLVMKGDEVFNFVQTEVPPLINKVVLLNADVLSPKVSKRDRNSNPLIGDAASITIIEKSNDNSVIYGSIKMDGAGAMALNIPAGGAKLQSSEATAELKEDASGNFRSQDHLVMKGDEVFNFVQTEVPPLINNLIASAKIEKEEIDYFMFHQPNRFMLQKLADKIGVSRDIMPSNVVENYGNSSGVTIPLVITHNISEVLKEKTQKLCLSGFGVGLTWAALIMDIGPLEFCEIIEY